MRSERAGMKIGYSVLRLHIPGTLLLAAQSTKVLKTTPCAKYGLLAARIHICSL